MDDKLAEAALAYHAAKPAGKLAITATKPLASQRDLALAYSPGVAFACDAIVADPAQASVLTARANLVAVVTNGTAVLGLGAIGALASKPVMEGKAVLFKKFSGIDVFDIEVDELDADRFVDIVASLEPTFGGINLEDIKAPECFDIERKLRERMNIPVFHDDQHGTAIIVSAAIMNGLRLVEKPMEDAKLVVSGAGAAALACLDLLVHIGMRKENIVVTDILGVVYEGRNEQMDKWKARYARDTSARVLDDVIEGADVFLGLSAPGVLTADMVARMGARPLILALANPTPEIMPGLARKARPDAIICTGRSDYPNQVNNVLCFPFIFRGALDVGATDINEEMKLACVKAIADLAMAESSDLVAKAYGESSSRFGPDYLIPKPFDPRLITQIAPAVAKAAMDSGVATRPITDWEAYQQSLTEFVFRSGMVMKPVIESARRSVKRVVYAEGEDRRVLRAAQQVIDEGIGRPILVGRANIIRDRIRQLGLRMVPDDDVEICNILRDDRYVQYWNTYHLLMGRKGVTPEIAKQIVRSDATVVAAIMLHLGEADAMLCGTVGRFDSHLAHVEDIVGKREGVRDLSAMTVLILGSGTFFICDTHVTQDPDAAELAEMAILASEEVRNFGITPKVALVSRSNFGSSHSPSSTKIRAAVELLREAAPELQADGEMQADAALSQVIRDERLPNTGFEGQANLLVMPNVDAANIAHNLLKMLGGGVSIGPILLGTERQAHVVSQSVTVRGLVNMTALACSRAGAKTEVQQAE
ncbi:MAG: malate dehydrogenase (oxaloacetate-decarboxylating)(NADP+) [Gammaproteobacteria bacterium]|jgi:malate dehydrogenase (oxaloacetate-decarboxylating)(NADP+)